MGFKKIAVTTMKLEVGATVSGYLVAAKIKQISGDDGAFDLCQAVLKTPTDTVSVWIQGDFAHVLKKGLMTRLTKEKTVKDGEVGSKIVVEQDDMDTISVFDK